MWNIHHGEKKYEVIEVIDGKEASSSCDRLLGFDLSSGYNRSLLQWGLKSFPGLNTLPEPIRVFCELLNLYYAPQLNHYGLFQTFAVATSCLRSMKALQTLSPNLYEGGDFNRFSVVGVFSVENLIPLIPTQFHEGESPWP